MANGLDDGVRKHFLAAQRRREKKDNRESREEVERIEAIRSRIASGVPPDALKTLEKYKTEMSDVEIILCNFYRDFHIKEVYPAKR